GQQLRAERGVLLDEGIDDRPDRVALELERLGAAHVRAKDRRDVGRAHARASGETLPARPVIVMANGTSAPTESTWSGCPAFRASTAASEQTGQVGSRPRLSPADSLH